ncbi:hypothetical protein [Robbsia andropogonis]|uniref:hypothetical protein n=1 Tax=Robbsia andropogonis TaxID=28092 RepID=UPI0009E0682D|nr:hypothetical protein [Robbsia andropogonis]MCP1117089.1 hypothetical protein [Robbsia andropogonis]
MRASLSIILRVHHNGLSSLRLDRTSRSLASAGSLTPSGRHPFLLASIANTAIMRVASVQGGFGSPPGNAGALVTPLVVCITVGSITNSRIVTRLKRPDRVGSHGNVVGWR